jgi:hypothetical protein
MFLAFFIEELRQQSKMQFETEFKREFSQIEAENGAQTLMSFLFGSLSWSLLSIG